MMGGTSHSVWSESDGGIRKIEVQQNWLARLFRVKPAMRHLCFNIPKRRARQEVAILLREWRKYGIKDVEVDKERNIIFARVGARNCKSPPCLLSLPSRSTLTGTSSYRPQPKGSFVCC